MNGNRFGTLFQVSTWGESHGPSLGALVDGCPSGIPLTEADFAPDMARRQGGSGSIATPRKEEDRVAIESGAFEGRTLGTPISLRILNGSQKSGDYEAFRDVPRPGHADLTTYFKHDHRDHRGGGRSSARETASRVAAGVVAKKILALRGIELAAWLSAAGPHEGDPRELSDLSLEEIRSRRDASSLGAPYAAAGAWAEEAERLRAAGESWGGRISCRADGLPGGLGEPVFDKLSALLAHAMMSLPAAVAFEAGGGLAMSRARGTEVRDPIARPAGEFAHLSVPALPVSNRHGGLLGGMTTGLPLLVSVAFHGPTSVPHEISSVNLKTGAPENIKVGGRHDAFPLPRALVVVEAMMAITLADAMLRAGRVPEKI